jgi:hypothetical protein
LPLLKELSRCSCRGEETAHEDIHNHNPHRALSLRTALTASLASASASSGDRSALSEMHAVDQSRCARFHWLYTSIGTTAATGSP